MRKDYIFTSESVSEGHPDKVSDRISDAVVDHFIAKDPFARVACETLTTTNKVVLSGEVRGPVQEDKEEIISKVRDCIKDIGYEQDGFHWKTADIQYLLHGQSADIAMGVDSSSDKDEGAGDQGIMFGYACNETTELMPAPIFYSHKILEIMAKGRKDGSLKGLEPDSKSQVTLKYVDGKPNAVTSVVISTQHADGLSPSDVKEIVNPALKQSIPEELLKNLDDSEYYVNPTGNFVIGGPDGDTGLTGRKIIVDTYGGYAPHGGGAFSGKDCTKVDRSGAYMARYIAINIVAAKLGHLGQTASTLSITNGGVNYEDATYPTVSFVSLTGTGSGAVGVVTVSSGVITGVTVIDGSTGTGYQVGDTLSASLGTRGLGQNLLLTVGVTTGVNSLLLTNSKGTFDTTNPIQYHDATLGYGVTVAGIIPSTVTTNTDQYDGLHFKVSHPNHGNHAANNTVKINGITGDILGATAFTTELVFLLG